MQAETIIQRQFSHRRVRFYADFIPINSVFPFAAQGKPNLDERVKFWINGPAFRTKGQDEK